MEPPYRHHAVSIGRDLFTLHIGVVQSGTPGHRAGGSEIPHDATCEPRESARPCRQSQLISRHSTRYRSGVREIGGRTRRANTVTDVTNAFTARL
jgi:hypothetical protein